MRTEVELLKWAAGVAAQVPDEPDIDTDLLLAALWQHKLTGRLLRRIDAEQPVWCSAALTELLHAQLRDVQANLAVRMDLLTEIGQAAVRTGEDPVLVVKGITSAVLTGDETFTRRSNDIDLLWHDPERLRQLLLELDYTPADDHCRGHEYAALYKRGVKADVHRYFPVESPTRASSTSAPGMIPTTRFAESAVGFSELSRGAVASGLPGIQVPGLESAVLIAVSHSYREYAHQPFPLAAGTVRIGELLEIYTLVGDPRFASRRFRELAERYRAWQSVAFVDHMLTGGLGLSRLWTGADGAQQARFPYDLWLDGFVIDDGGVDPPTYFLRPREATMARLVARLGGEEHTGQVTFGTGSGLEAPVPAVRYVQGEGVATTLTIRLEGEAVAVEARICDPGGVPSVQLMINSGDVLHEITWDRAAGAPRVSWQRNNAAGRQWRHPIELHGSDSGTPALSSRFPPEALDPRSEAGSRSLLVGVRAGDDKGVLVPITIRP